jgi:DNA-binding CsgD family transcriptional regulator/tetratricopeptide (TPR) repeat protein
MFCDVEESTAARVEVGEAAADKLFVEHLRALAEVVERRNGRVLKTAGDGIMATFTSSSDAISAAVDVQRSVQRRTPELRVRIGIAAGDVAYEGDDCFGLPVVTAARLEATAQGGQIVVDQVVRWLAGERSGTTFEPLGPLELKGLAGPVEAFLVPWSGEGDPSVEPPPFPTALTTSSDLGFVGRSAEWNTLEQLWRSAVSGVPQVALLGGEAGAGKTRLAAEFARSRLDDGAAVLFGSCDAHLVVPYQPWVQALDQLLRVVRPEELAAETAADLGALAGVMPSLDRTVGTTPHSGPIDADMERLRLFEAVEAVLAEASNRWPVVLVVDDLHWASAQTLALLARLARAAGLGRMLVIGTFRDTGDEVTEPLVGVLADLRRVSSVTRLRIEGLGADEVAALVAEATGGDLAPALRRLATSVAERSRGNAFFVGELWRRALETGVVRRDGERWVVDGTLDDVGVPESVREVVADRLGRLAFPVRRLAELVAVSGHRVDLQVLSHAADLQAAELAKSLDELVSAELLEVVQQPRLTYQFTHALVRDTVESKVPPAARAHLHLQLADALETVFEADRRSVLAQLANHYAAASSLGAAAKAVYYARQAAEQARRSLAYEESLAHLATVLALCGERSVTRVEVLLDRGWTESRRSRFEDGMSAYEEAFRLAVDLGEHRLAVEAAIGFEDAVHTPGLPGEPAVEVVRAALAVAGDLDQPDRARLQAALARALTHAGRLDEADAALQEALSLGKASGDREALAAGLEAAVILYTDPVVLLDHSEQLTAIGTQNNDPWRSAYGTINVMRACTMLGDLDRVGATLEQHRSFGRGSRYLLVEIQALAFGLTLALAAGRFPEAEAAAERAVALGRGIQGDFAAGVHGLQMFAIRREQGRLGEVRPVLELLNSRGDADAVWRPGLAVLYAELDMLDEARHELEAVAPDRFGSLARDTLWPGGASFLADACVATAAVEHAPVLYDEMLAFRGQNLMMGMTVSVGPADRLLGALAGLLGQDDAARDHFDTALALAERSRSPVWRARVLHDRARWAAGRGDAAEALTRAEAALADAASVGMPTLEARCGAIADAARAGVPPPPARPAYPDGLSGREVDVLRLVAEGCSNRVIGERLSISSNTAANHVRSILQKTGTANRAEAATYAARRGLLDD